MKALRKWVLYLVGAYTLIAGVIAIVYPALAASLFAVARLSPEWSAAARWVGALAIPVSYAAFIAGKTDNKEAGNLILIAGLTSEIANILNLATGDARWASVIVDLVIWAIVLAVLLPGLWRTVAGRTAAAKG